MFPASHWAPIGSTIVRRPLAIILRPDPERALFVHVHLSLVPLVVTEH